MYLQRFFAILILTTSIELSIGNEIFTQYLQLTSKLKYGDSCSWENEKIRREFSKALVETDSSTKENATAQFFINVITNQRTLCSASELFVCSKETETCVCGDPGKAAVLPELITKGYVIEVKGDQKKCRWALETGCSPGDLSKKIGLNEDDSTCRQGTTCASKSDGKPCNYVTLKNYSLGKKQIIQDTFEGKICTCQADADVYKKIDLEKDKQAEFVSGRLQRVRAKRGVVLDKDAEVAFPSGGVMAPILIMI